MKHFFLLDPQITYLNHGSFGACAKPIFEDYQRWQLELEREPVQFITSNSLRYLQKSKEALAKYINCDADDFYFTPNPTHAINTIMRSIGLEKDDEILATNQEYGAMDRTWKFYERMSGVKYVRSEIRLPVVSKEQIINDFWKGLTPKTKAIFINQMSSATALLFPVKEICDKAREVGLFTIVDGAHIPGHLSLNITSLNADFYTGTLHKWMMTPKGSSFLYVRKELQNRINPLVVSWGYDNAMPGSNRFLDYHEQQGTRDISTFLTAPAALKFMNENNWTDVAASCRDLVLKNYKRFCDLVGTVPVCPVTEEFLGQMCSIPINTDQPAALKELLFDKYKIEVPVMHLNGQNYLRFSVQAYNSQEDLDILYSAIKDILQTTSLINVHPL
ncbi:MAG: aminotransferase class V-fold PLP-dependent enzyme [Flavobacterium sp.]|nr:MAG: aminotransferase class V-fold PLP-dependent enzyme [Flavobacterium sp.]